MGKSNSGIAQSSKSSIAKEKLSDRDFDELVIGTSHEVTQRSLLHELPSPDSSSAESHSRTTSSDTAVGIAEFNHLTNQPKRPMNAFMVWGQAIRRELHGKFSNVQNALLSKALGRVWRSLDPTDKEMFVRKANLIKANHKRDYPNYRYRPRRLQERRAKCNMLIGIQLNHPVNQHPTQSSFALDHTVSYPLNQTQQTSGRDQLPRQMIYDKHNLMDSAQDKDNLAQFNNESADFIRQAGPVQTFEYQPYPADFQSSQLVSRTCHTMSNSRNGKLCPSNQKNHVSFQEFEQHGMAATTKQEFEHPLYRQYAYSLQHPQQYQSQQQSSNYNVVSCYSSNSRLPSTNCNSLAGEYYAGSQQNLTEKSSQGFFVGN